VEKSWSENKLKPSNDSVLGLIGDWVKIKTAHSWLYWLNLYLLIYIENKVNGVVRRRLLDFCMCRCYKGAFTKQNTINLNSELTAFRSKLLFWRHWFIVVFNINVVRVQYIALFHTVAHQNRSLPKINIFCSVHLDFFYFIFYRQIIPVNF